jgi:hypothetical protein
VGLGCAVGIKDNLSHPIAIAQIDKNQRAMIASAIDPTRQRDFLSSVF